MNRNHKVIEDDWVMVDKTPAASETESESDGISIISESEIISSEYDPVEDFQGSVEKADVVESVETIQNTGVSSTDSIETDETQTSNLTEEPGCVPNNLQQGIQASNLTQLTVCIPDNSQHSIQTVSESDLDNASSYEDSECISTGNEEDTHKNAETQLGCSEDRTLATYVQPVPKNNTNIFMGLTIIVASILISYFLQSKTTVIVIKDEGEVSPKLRMRDSYPVSSELNKLYSFCVEKHRSSKNPEKNTIKCVRKTVKYLKNIKIDPLLLERAESYLHEKQQYAEDSDLQIKMKSKFKHREDFNFEPKKKKKRYKEHSPEHRKGDYDTSKTDFYIEVANLENNYVTLDELVPLSKGEKKNKKAKNLQRQPPLETSEIIKENKHTDSSSFKITEDDNQYRDRKIDASEKYYEKPKYKKEKEFSIDCFKKKNKYKKFCKESLDKKLSKDYSKNASKYACTDKKDNKKDKYKKKDKETLITYDPKSKTYGFIEMNMTGNNLKNILHELKANKTVSGKWLSNYYKARSDIRKKQHEADWLFDRANFRKHRRDKAKWYFDWMENREEVRLVY